MSLQNYDHKSSFWGQDLREKKTEILEIIPHDKKIKKIIT